MFSYVWRDLIRNPRRTLASVAGVSLAVGLFAGIAFFVDGAAAQMTSRAIAPVTIDMQAGITSPLAPNRAINSPLDLTKTAEQIRAVPGVTKVAGFGSLELPAGSVTLSGSTINAPVSVIAVDPNYLKDFPLVKITTGNFTPGQVTLSRPAADLPGATGPVAVTLPGQTKPITLPVAGTADFSQASQLFLSRNPDTQGDFAGSPYVLLTDLATFRQSFVPAYRVDSAAAIKNAPVLEFHVAVSHDLLSSDPGTAAVTTQGLRRTIERVAPGEITVTDNLTDALNSAKKDSILAKTLFIFLGLPGVLLAAYLSRYAGGLLAEAQRRERATLRARGMRPALMVRSLAYSTAAVAIIGSAVGLALGFGVIALLFRDTQALPSSAGSYALSIGLALLAALLTTTVALYVPGRRALVREVSAERREITATTTPAWMRARLDLILLALAALVGLITYLTGGYKPAVAAEAQSVSLSFYVLLAPVLFWVGATLLAVRGLLGGARVLANRARPSDFEHHVVRRTLRLSVLRRPHALASGIIALSLAVAFGASLMVFVNTYQSEKLADARYVLGGDIRVTSSVSQAGATAITDQLKVPGVQNITPAAQSSAVIVGTEKRALVGIDPATFAQVAPLSPAFFIDTTPEAALAALASDPNAVLIDKEVSKAFNVQIGDPVKVQIPNARTGQPTPITLHAVGTFTNFPAFPQGVDLVTNLTTYQAAAGLTAPDFYLLATDGTDTTNAAVVSALDAGPGRASPILVESTAKAINKEQSTLAALNLTGLGRIEITFTLLMSALGIAIFVFGLLLQRHKEHVTLRALGVSLRDLLTLVLGEAGIAAVAALVIGLVVGIPMAFMSVQILQPVFTIPPNGINLPIGQLGVLVTLVLAAMIVASALAASSLRRTHLVEILRED